jgi:hypothetical protein
MGVQALLQHPLSPNWRLKLKSLVYVKVEFEHDAGHGA